jgi:ribonuclease VapC
VGDSERYTLDTSAFIAHFADEPGSDRLEELLKSAGTGRVELFASFMTYMETLYRLWRERGEKQGKLTYLRLKALPVKRVDVSEGLLLRAGRLKAEFDLSVADAWVAATALLTGSRLVHKDPQFRPLDSRISLIELPMKTKRARRQRVT